MTPTEDNPETHPEARDTTLDLPVVKPKGASRTSSGRSTLEDRVGAPVRPASVTPSAARSTFRDLHTL